MKNIIKKIINYFKRKFKKKENIDLKEKRFKELILPKLHLGDVIYAKRYNNSYEQHVMGENHDTGPYIVVDIVDDKIIGCYCTSSKKYFGSFIVGEDYPLFNRSTPTLALAKEMKSIDAEAFLGFGANHLDEEDVKRLLKHIILNKRNKYDDFYLKRELELNINVELEKMDIIFERNKFYLILDIDDKGYHCLHLQFYHSYSSHLDFTKQKMNDENIKILPKKEYTYVNTIDVKQREIIYSKYAAYRKMKEERAELIRKNILVRGCIIKYHKHLYYVYGICGKKANAFRINNETYCYGEEIELDVDDEKAQIIRIVSPEEMKKNSDNRKSYLKKAKERIEKQRKKLPFNVGNVISHKKIFCARFLIVNIEDDIMKAINFDALVFDFKIIEKEFSLDDMDIVLCTLTPLEKKQAMKGLSVVEMY